MKLKKILTLTAVCCSLALPMAAAQVSERVTRSIDRDLSVPYVELQKPAATKLANNAIKDKINAFAMMHTVVDHLYLRYEVVSENESYISLLLCGEAYMKGTAHGAKEGHSLVINAKTGKVMEMKDFVNLPHVEKIKDGIAEGTMKVYFIDRKQELTSSLAKNLKHLPTEFIVDEDGCVYLLLTEQAHYVTDTPLLKLDPDRCREMYRNRK